MHRLAATGSWRLPTPLQGFWRLGVVYLALKRQALRLCPFGAGLSNLARTDVLNASKLPGRLEYLIEFMEWATKLLVAQYKQLNIWGATPSSKLNPKVARSSSQSPAGS